MDSKKYKEVLSRAMALCSKSEKCRSEIRSRLPGWGLEDGRQAEMIIEELINQDFINEERYSRLFASEKHRINKWGRVKITAMLKSRGINEDLISGAVREINQEQYEEQLRDELIKKRKTIKGSNLYDLKGKLLRFARSRGYELDLIYRLINDITTP